MCVLQFYLQIPVINPLNTNMSQSYYKSWQSFALNKKMRQIVVYLYHSSASLHCSSPVWQEGACRYLISGLWHEASAKPASDTASPSPFLYWIPELSGSVKCENLWGSAISNIHHYNISKIYVKMVMLAWRRFIINGMKHYVMKSRDGLYICN